MKKMTTTLPMECSTWSCSRMTGGRGFAWLCVWGGCTGVVAGKDGRGVWCHVKKKLGSAVRACVRGPPFLWNGGELRYVAGGPF